MRATEILNENTKTDYLNGGEAPVVNGLRLELARIKNPSRDTGYAGVLPQGVENFLAVIPLSAFKDMIKDRLRVTPAKTLKHQNPEKQIGTLKTAVVNKFYRTYEENVGKMLSKLSDRELEKLWNQSRSGDKPEEIWKNYRGNWDQIDNSIKPVVSQRKSTLTLNKERPSKINVQEDDNKSKVIQQLVLKFNTEQMRTAGLKSYLDSIESLKDYEQGKHNAQQVIDDLTVRINPSHTDNDATWSDDKIDSVIDTLDQKYGDQYSYRDTNGRSLIRIATTKDPRQAAYIRSWVLNRSTGADLEKYISALIGNTKDLPPALTKLVTMKSKDPEREPKKFWINNIDVPSVEEFDRLGIPVTDIDRDEIKATDYDKHPTLVKYARENGYETVKDLRKDLGLTWHIRTAEQLIAKIQDAKARGFGGFVQMKSDIEKALADGAGEEYGVSTVKNWTFDDLLKWKNEKELENKKWYLQRKDDELSLHVDDGRKATVSESSLHRILTLSGIVE